MHKSKCLESPTGISLSQYCAEVRNSNTIGQSDPTICRSACALLWSIAYFCSCVRFLTSFFVHILVYALLVCVFLKRFGRWHVLIYVSFRTSVASWAFFPRFFSIESRIFCIFCSETPCVTWMQIWRIRKKRLNIKIEVHMTFEKNKRSDTSALSSNYHLLAPYCFWRQTSYDIFGLIFTERGLTAKPVPKATPTKWKQI